MRILHLVLSLRYSGAEVLVRDVCHVHQNAGDVCAIGALDSHEPEFGMEIDNLSLSGVQIFDPVGPSSRVKRLLGYANAIRAFQPDVIFAHSFLPSVYGRAACIVTRSRVPFVNVLHSGSDDFRSLIPRTLEAVLEFRNDAVVAVGHQAAEYYWRRFKKCGRPALIQNGLDLAKMENANAARDYNRRRMGLSQHDRLILQVGRLMDNKNQALVLQGLKRVLESDTRVKLWFAGLVEDADYGRGLERDIQRSGLDSRVKMLGSRSDVPELLSAADLFVMPSQFEAQGIALLEALASGVPVIASKIIAFEFAREMPGVELLDLGSEWASDGTLAVVTKKFLSQDTRYRRNLQSYSVVGTAESYRALAERLLV